MSSAHKAQDGFVVEQADGTKWDAPDWNQSELSTVRDHLLALKQTSKEPPIFGFFTGPEKIDHCGARALDQTYLFWVPQGKSGTFTLKMLADVPLEHLGMWSVTVYSKEGFVFALPSKYSSAVQGPNGLNPDVSTTLYFGGCDNPQRQKPSPAHCMPTQPGWVYVARFFRPDKAILEGSWAPPDATADLPRGSALV